MDKGRIPFSGSALKV